MARIGLVSYWAPPQGAVASHRILRLSRVLLDAGHEVHWVTLDRSKLDRVDASLEGLIPPQIVRHGLGGPNIVARGPARTFWAKVQVTAGIHVIRLNG